jgi:hypothetical protein
MTAPPDVQLDQDCRERDCRSFEDRDGHAGDPDVCGHPFYQRAAPAFVRTTALQAGREKWSHALSVAQVRISSTRSANARLRTGDSHESCEPRIKGARQPDGEVVRDLVPMPPLSSGL